MPARTGFTLAELVVSLALLGILVALLLNTLTTHQKVFRSLRERILLSEQLRDGELALLADMRGAAVHGDTLRLLTDSAFEFFATIASSVVCTKPASQVIALVPAGLSSGLSLTSAPMPPDTGDLVAIYARPDSLAGNRRWVRYRISAVTTGVTSAICPPESGYTTAFDAARPAYRISLSGALDEIMPGAPVRILRRGRYSLYRSSDGGWYLGYKRCNAVATGCSTVQPISGPYLPHMANGAGGLRFVFLDSAGLGVSANRPLDVRTIQVTLRAEVAGVGRVAARSLDSVIFLVTPRNLH